MTKVKQTHTFTTMYSRAPGCSTSMRASTFQRQQQEEDRLLGGFYQYQRIEASRDCLFFIKYEATGTMVPQWYLVQVNLDETDPLMEKRLGEHQCLFLVLYM